MDSASGLMRLAEKEFAERTLPLTLVRRSPSGENQVCAVSNLTAPANKMELRGGASGGPPEINAALPVGTPRDRQCEHVCSP